MSIASLQNVAFVARRAMSVIATNGFLLLVAMLHAGCASSWGATPILNENSSPSQDVVILAASPNPVPAAAGSGKTTISWNTGDGSTGEVYVLEKGYEERIFARGSEGSSDATWIGNKGIYEFRLYSMSEPRTLLAAITVTGNSETLNSQSLFLPRLERRDAINLAMFGFVLLLLAAVCYASQKISEPMSRRLYFIIALLSILLALFSVLSVKPRPLKDQPFPDSHEYADAARQLATGNGYATYIYHNERRPPRYPPGFSLALAPFAAFGDYPSNVQTGAKFFAVFYVLAAVTAAWMFGGPIAATLVAMLIGVSPFARASGSLVLSDAFAASLVVLSIPLLRHLSRWRAAVLGLLAGALVAVRLPMIINFVGLLIVLPMIYRLWMTLFAAPPLAALGLYNWMNFGSPFKTGYSHWLPNVVNFEWSNAVTALSPRDGPWIVTDVLNGAFVQWVCPCGIGGAQAALPSIVFYPLVLLGVFWIFAPPFLTLPGVIYIWRHRRERASAFTFWTAGANLVFFTFYFYQGARFMAATATALTVFTCIMLSQWIEGRIAPERIKQTQ